MKPRAWWAYALVVTCIVAPGCGGGGGARGGVAINSSDSCVATLPLAFRTVHNRGKLVRVHRLRRGQSSDILRRLGVPAAGPRLHEARRCIVIYRGSYTRKQFGHAVGQRGRYAVLIMKIRRPRVIHVVLTDALPRGVRR
jgi:hypothetical protein